MAIFELEIGDADVQRVFDAVCGNCRRQPLVPNPDYHGFPVDENGDPIPQAIENPETQGQFTHRKVREFLSDHVISWETKQAKIAAVSSIDTSVVVNDPNSE